MLERLEGEAAQEVLKLQEELSVIQAADGADDETLRNFRDVRDVRDFPRRWRVDALDQPRARRIVVTALSLTAPLPAPRTTPPTRWRSGRARQAIREAARTIGEQIATDGRAVEREPEEYLVSGKPAVDGETLAARRRHREGGEQLERRIVEGENPKRNQGGRRCVRGEAVPGGASFCTGVQTRCRRACESGERKAGEKNASRGRPVADALGARAAGAPGSSREDNLRRLKRYELYADVSVEAYDRIRHSRTMLSDHFLPKYIEALEDVRAGLEDDDGDLVAIQSLASARRGGVAKDAKKAARARGVLGEA